MASIPWFHYGGSSSSGISPCTDSSLDRYAHQSFLLLTITSVVLLSSSFGLVRQSTSGRLLETSSMRFKVHLETPASYVLLGNPPSRGHVSQPQSCFFFYDRFLLAQGNNAFSQCNHDP